MNQYPNNSYEPYEPTQLAPGTSAYPPTMPQPSGPEASPYPPSPYGPQASGNASNPYFSPYPETPPPPPAYTQGGFTPSPVPRRFQAGLVVLLLVLILLLIGGSGLIYYVGVYQPNLKHAQATATAVVQLTGTAHAQATAAVENPYSHSGTLVLSDPLSVNSKSQSWDEDTNCAFTSGAYHAIAPDARYSDYCVANATAFSNFTFEVDMKIIKGDAGGVIFRVESTNPNQYYAFYTGQDGSYALEVVNGSTDSTLKQGSSAAIKQGLNQTNLIGVIAEANSITLYVNHQLIGSVTDHTYNHGQIGVYGVVYNQPTEVAFSNARVWML